jgi:tetratricopeptide (TPR) repeat protein/transcriptional regulator with XRE-family HTH domain
MRNGPELRIDDAFERRITRARTLEDLAELLRALRRRHARDSRDSELTYRELAARTGWSQTAIAEYFTARTLPPTDRFDALVTLLGATPAEQAALANARDRVEEHRRGGARAARLTGSEPAAVTPRQLPAATRQFAGRAAELAALTRLLEQPPPPGTVLVALIGGTAGVGKTALAVHWAHRVADRFPDGQLFVNLRGFDPGGTAMLPQEAIRGFLDALQVAPERIPVGLDAQAALYRSVLAGRRMLVVLDNAHDTAQVRPLLPGSAGSVVLVTSRNHLTGLVATDGAQVIALDLLSQAEAGELLVNRLGRDRTVAEPDAVDGIITGCARLPLALSIVAARAATNPQLPLAALREELGDARRRWGALSGDDAGTDVRAVMSWSYHALGGEAARLFRALGLHQGPDISLAAAASLAGLPVARLRPLLAELVRANLVSENSAGRYAFHDLLRAYATEQAHATDPPDDRRAVTRRVLDHYLHSAYAAALVINPHRDPIALAPPASGVGPESPDDYPRALAWFTTEHPVLLAVIDDAAANGWDGHTWQLAWTLAEFLERQGHWHDSLATQRAAVAAAQRSANPAAQALAHRYLARAYRQLGRFDDALAHYYRALDLSRQAGDLAEQAHIHGNLGMVWTRQGHHTRALEHAGQALDLYHAAGHRVGQAVALNNLAWLYTQLDDARAAVVACEQAITLHRELDNRHGEADTWDTLGYAHHRLDQYPEAVACFQRAIDMYRDLGDRYREANTLVHLGDTRQAAGDQAKAHETWRLALAILTELQHPHADQVRTRLTTTG